MRRWSAVALASTSAVAFLPAIAAWVARVREEPGVRYVVAIPVLLGLAALRSSHGAAPRAAALGVASLIAAAALQVGALLAGFPKGTVAALPFAVGGALVATGAASPAAAAIAGFLVPLPFGLASLVRLHDLWASGATAIWGGTAPLLLGVWDSGVPLALAFAAFGWHAAIAAGRSPGTAALRAAAIGSLGLPAQLLAVVVAWRMALAGLEQPARAFLSYAPWTAALAITLWRSARVPGGTLAR